MCHSNSQCKTIRNTITSFSLARHQEQVETCHFCITHDNQNVNHSIVHKTDYKVRISYVNRYYDHIKELQKAE